MPLGSLDDLIEIVGESRSDKVIINIINAHVKFFA